MKSIIEYVNEDKEQQIDEAFDGFSLFAGQMTFLILTIGLFVKSFKDILEGENGIIEVANVLIKDAKVNRICKKLSKDPDVQQFISKKENVKKDTFSELIKSKLPEKDSQYLIDITKSKLEEYMKK